MNRRILIEVDRSISNEMAIPLVCEVIAAGRVSESRGVLKYCHLTTFAGGIEVYCRDRRNIAAADSFVVRRRKRGAK